MASEEESINVFAHREVLSSFSLSETETSLEQNLCHAHAHHDSLMCQWIPAEDAPEMAQVLDAKRRSIEQIIEEEQAHRAQVVALSQMQLQTMEWVDTQEKELQRLSTLLVEHKALLQSLPERPQQENTKAPAGKIDQLRHEAFDYLPRTININRGAASRTGQVPDLSGPPTVKRDIFEDILTDAEVPVTPQRWVQFADMAKSMPIVLGKPAEPLVEWTPQIYASQVPQYEQGPLIHLEPQKDLFQEGFGHIIQAAAMVFKNIKRAEGGKTNRILAWCSICGLRTYGCMYWVLPSHWEAIQLVKDCTSEHAQLEVEYYLGLTPVNKQSFQGLIDHLSLTFQSGEMVSFLIGDFYNQSQKARETGDAFAGEL